MYVARERPHTRREVIDKFSFISAASELRYDKVLSSEKGSLFAKAAKKCLKESPANDKVKWPENFLSDKESDFILTP